MFSKDGQKWEDQERGKVTKKWKTLRETISEYIM